MRNHIFYIENRSYLLADQPAVRMGDTVRFIDINPEDRIISRTFELQFDKLVPQALDSHAHQLSDAVPIQYHTHNNKKVGETPTRKNPRRKYRGALTLNQPPFDNDLRMNTSNTAPNPSAVLYSRLAQYCWKENDRSNRPNRGKKRGTRSR